MRRFKLWVAVSASIVTSALLMPIAGASKSAETHTGVKGSVRYSCQSVCYDRYLNCLGGGGGSTYCGNQYNICLTGCMGGASSAK